MEIGIFKNHNKLLYLLGHLGMLGIMCLAWVLWLERSTVFDSSLYSYMIITRESVYVPNDRLINYLWQWMPILSLKLGVSLSTFLKVISVAPVVLLYGAYGLISHGLKNALAGIYLVLSLVILTRYMFYSSISEIYLGTSIIAILAAWLTSDQNQNRDSGEVKNIVIGMILVSLCFLGHPLIFYPLFVVLGFDYLIRGKWKSIAHFVWIGLGGFLFLIKFLMGRGSAHESRVMDGFFQSVLDQSFVEKTLELYSMDIFMRYAETQWAFPLIICAAMMVYLISQKKYLAVAFLLLANSAWVVLVVHLCGYLEWPYLFMIDGYFGLMSVMWLLPLLYIKPSQTWFPAFRLAVAAGLIIFGLHRIYSVRPFFEDRISDINSKMEQGIEAGARNTIFAAGTKNWDTYWFLWSVPFESVMHSSLKEIGKTSVLIIDSYPDQRYIEEPFEIMIGTDKDTLSNMKNPYFDFDGSPFVQMK